MTDFTAEQKRAREAGVTPLGIIGADALNEYAAHFFAGNILLSRRPCEPSFWFFNFALDAKVWSWGPKLRALLSEESKVLLAAVDLKDYSKWCSCCDRAFDRAAMLPRGCDVDCWPCLFDCHDLCSHDCTNEGIVAFPETIMRTKAAA